MKVIKRIKDIYPQDPTKYFHLERFEKECGNFVLIESAFEEHSLWDGFNLTKKKLNRVLQQKIVRLEFEDPDKLFIGDNPDHYDHLFFKIFTICPYTANWLNKRQHNKKHIPIFFPFNEEFIPKKNEKKYDIIYTGHIFSKSIREYINTIAKFNYRVVSNSNYPLVTNHGISYINKMKLITQSKITLVANLLYLRPHHLFNVWRIPGYRENQAFKYVPRWFEVNKWLNKEIIVPHLKSRLFEAAFARSLILCRKDPFNIVERFFTPNKEFVYFDTENLENTIRYILNNYQKYEKVIERAYKRAIDNYTTKKFVGKYLKKI